MALRQRDIVWATIRPARGEAKQRPAVVVTPDGLLKPGGTVRLAGISTSFDPDDPWVVPLPWRADGNIYTGLRKPSAACAKLPADAVYEDVELGGGYINKVQLIKLLTLMRAAGTA